MCMRWVWLGHIGKCGPHSSKLGVQYGPPACGRRSILHPQFLRIRYAFTDAPSPDSPHSSNSLVLKSRELEILVFHFSLYYNVIGGGMARRYWKIPSSSLGEKNWNSPLAASPLAGNSFFSPRDSEEIFQYLLAISKPLYQYVGG